MGEIVDINQNKPHMSGPAKCLNCGHKWQAVILKDGYEGGFECSECGQLKGEFVGTFVPKEMFKCSCECDLFFLTPDGKTMCPNCGDVKDFPIFE